VQRNKTKSPNYSGVIATKEGCFSSNSFLYASAKVVFSLSAMA